MKIALAYGPFSTAGRLLDFRDDKMFSSSNGMTGSETSCLMIAQGLRDLGHDVTIFAPIDPSDDGYSWRSIHIKDFKNIQSVINKDWHAIYAWNEANLLRNVSWETLRICNLQINDFAHCLPGFDDHVDVWTSPSESHRQSIGSKSPRPEKWTVIHNGCDPSLYSDEFVDGRVVWASSPDRGLHLLLSVWPQIINRVPRAHLNIYYKVAPWVEKFVNENPAANRIYPELIARAFYIKESLRRLKDHKVTLKDSVSRNDMTKVWNEAHVLAYPCDTIDYTEGFSVSIMEACASYTVPVITDADALGPIYGDSVPMVPRPFSDNSSKYVDLVVKSLTDREFRDMTVAKCRELSLQFSWSRISKQVENLIVSHRQARSWPV